MDDHELIRRVLNGDELAGSMLVSLYGLRPGQAYAASYRRGLIGCRSGGYL